LIAFGNPCPVSGLFGHAGRELLYGLEIADPWRQNIDVSLGLIDDLELQIAALTVQLKRRGAEHRCIPAADHRSGSGWINALTIASEIGDRPLRLAGQAVRLHRAVPTRQAVRGQRRARPALQARSLLRDRYSREYEIERLCRDAPLLLIGEGTSEIQRMVIGKRLPRRRPSPRPARRPRGTAGPAAPLPTRPA
jgi:hypothetical protein